jgi:hypothetical protein
MEEKDINESLEDLFEEILKNIEDPISLDYFVKLKKPKI